MLPTPWTPLHTQAPARFLAARSIAIDFAAGAVRTGEAFARDDGDGHVQSCRSNYMKFTCFRGGHTHFTDAETHLFRLDQYDTFAISHAEEASQTSGCIARLFQHDPRRRTVITDACAGCGGNTIQFACSGAFAAVNAVEMNPERCEQYLRHNVRAAEKMRPRQTHNTQTSVRCGDYLELMDKLTQDVVFFDVPWGGPEYYKDPHLQLKLENHHLASIIHRLHANSRTTGTKHVVLKTPFNFDVVDMKQRLGALSAHFELLRAFAKWDLYAVSF